jgi:hypothetical protein
VTGIQFWITDYVQTVLLIEAPKVFTYYALTSISAPVLGVLAGGAIIHHFGGYESPHALKITCLSSLGALLSAIPVPFLDNFYLFQSLLWLLLFFGGFIVPIVTGIILVSVKPNERTVANSLANLSYNLLGYLPAPFLYGFVEGLSGHNQSRYGITLLMFATVPAFGLLLFCTYSNKVQDNLRKT